MLFYTSPWEACPEQQESRVKVAERSGLCQLALHSHSWAYSSVSSSVAGSEFARRERLRRAGPPPPTLGETAAKDTDDYNILCGLRCWEGARRTSQAP